MLARIVQACRTRLTDTVILGDGTGAEDGVHRLGFSAGLLTSYRRGAQELDPIAAILPDARRCASHALVDGYVERLGAMRLELKPCAIPSEALQGAEKIAWQLLRRGAHSVPEMLALGVDRRSVHAVVFALALCGRLVRHAQVAPVVAVEHPAIGTLNSDRVPPRVSGILPRVSRRPVKKRASAMTAVVAPPKLEAVRPTPAISLIAPAMEDRDSAHRAWVEAQRALKVLNMKLAHRLATRALDLAPDNADHRALHAYIEAELCGRPLPLSGDGHYAEQIATLSRVIDDAPETASAYYYRARLFQRLRRTREALADFQRASQLDPSNTDAARELREWGKRRSGQHFAAKDVPVKRGWFARAQ